MADIDFSLPPDAWTSSKENVGGHIEPAGHFFVLLFSKYFRFISCVSYFRGGIQCPRVNKGERTLRLYRYI
jgi:hypothetical protein